MKYTIYLITLITIFSCQNSKKNDRNFTVSECEDIKLLDYVYPINNFIEGNTLVYSLKSNRDSKTELIEQKYKSIITKDSLLISVSKNSNRITTDSTVFKFDNGVPKILGTYTKVDFHPKLLKVKKTIIGNRYCEFTSFNESFEYKIPINNGIMHRSFEGYTSHKEYVKRKFNSIEYDCAIFEAKKVMTTIYNGKAEKLEGTWTGCTCKNLGELYSTVVTEDGHIIEKRLKEVKRGNGTDW